MKIKIHLRVFIVLATIFFACNQDEESNKTNQPTLQLVWADEFDSEETIDMNKWGFDTGTPNNNEEQIYTSDQNNTKVENGLLKITAIKGEATAVLYYFDELNLLNSAGDIISEIESFEVNSPILNDFDGASTRIISNPDISNENSTSRVVEFTKTEGANGNAGVWWDRINAIDPSVNNKKV